MSVLHVYECMSLSINDNETPKIMIRCGFKPCRVLASRRKLAKVRRDNNAPLRCERILPSLEMIKVLVQEVKVDVVNVVNAPSS